MKKDDDIAPELTRSNMAMCKNADLLASAHISAECATAVAVKAAFDAASPSLPPFYEIVVLGSDGVPIIGKYNCENLPASYHDLDLLFAKVYGNHLQKLILIKEADEREDPCCICKESLPVKNYFNYFQRLDGCTHIIHKACKEKWEATGNTNANAGNCPICRAEM